MRQAMEANRLLHAMLKGPSGVIFSVRPELTASARDRLQVVGGVQTRERINRPRQQPVARCCRTCEERHRQPAR